MICLLTSAAVPQSLATKHSDVVVNCRPDTNTAILQNCGSVTISQLQAWSDAGTEGVAFSGGTCADILEQQLDLLRRMPRGNTNIVLADRPLPHSLSRSFCPRLRVLIQPFQSSDLHYIPASVLSSSDPQRTAWSVILQTAVDVQSLDHPPAMARFPEAGPGKAIFDSVTISSAVRDALSDHFGIYPHQSDEHPAGYHAACIVAGVLLMWNQLDSSHRASQSLEGEGNPQTADYWHGIMHRREPDLGNAAYWFRSLGRHPAFESLFTHLPEWISELRLPDSITNIIQHRLLQRPQWDPAAMIQLCRTALQHPAGPDDHALRVVQYFEIVNLLQFSLQRS